jgi:formate hydrogenlyase subunit 6/NADH:ubiquinone oxidoreductase subunit I
MKGYFQDMWDAGRTLTLGLSITLRHLFQKTVTMQYPDEKWELPPMAKGQLHNVIEDCIGCDQCANVCPVDCIYIETVKAPADMNQSATSTGNPRRLVVLRFDIDMAKCCYCALCTVPCPTECLVMTNSYENSVYERKDLIYHYGEFSPEQAKTMKVDIDAKLAAEAAAKKEATAARKAAAAKAAAEKAAAEGAEAAALAAAAPKIENAAPRAEDTQPDTPAAPDTASGDDPDAGDPKAEKE